MCCVHIHPGFASGGRTFRAKQAVPAERDTFAAWNVEYQDFIIISLYKNASMVFAWGHSLLRDELGKLSKSLFVFDYAEEFLGV